MLEGNLTRFHKISGVVAATRLKTFLQVESHQMFTGKFTRFWITKFNPKSPKFHRKTHHFHKSFGEFSMCKARLLFLLWKPGEFTRCSPGIGNSPGSSSSFDQLVEIHQVFTRFSDFSPSLGDESGAFRIASSFHCSDGRYVPSGKRLHHYGKSWKIHPCLMGKSTFSTGPCSTVFCLFSRGYNPLKSPCFLAFSPMKPPLNHH